MEKLDKTGFTTPDRYFDDLGERIHARISMERLKAEVPQDGFSVPENYFEQLNSKILSRLTLDEVRQPEAKTVRLWHSKFLKYASVACFVLVASFAVYVNQIQPSAKKPVLVNQANEQMLFDIDEEAIIEHMETNDQVQTTTSATDTEIENYILNNYSQNEIARNLKY